MQDGKKLEDVLFAELDGAYTDDNSSLLIESSPSSKSASDKIIADYTNIYGLTNYKAGAKTIVGKLIQRIIGENSWREKKPDSKHRIKVKLYNVDYGFYKNQGFRVEYNVLKNKTIKIWYIKNWRLTSKEVKLYSYWSSSKNASEMVVGIDYFQGYTEFTTFGLGDSFQQNMP